MSIVKHIPNAITSCSLLSGCVSVIFAFNGMLEPASVMIFLAGVFDFLDGFSARLLNAKSPIGADLDSLSDIVSFGVAPGMIFYCIMRDCMPCESLVFGNVNLAACMALMLPVFSALRLAKFNIDTRQTTSFIGMPTPAMAIFVASLPLASFQTGLEIHGTLAYFTLLALAVLLSALMVCEIGFFSFKMKSVAWRGNEVRWTFLALAVVGLAIFQLAALPFIMLLYIVLSVVTGLKTK